MLTRRRIVVGAVVLAGVVVLAVGVGPYLLRIFAAAYEHPCVPPAVARDSAPPGWDERTRDPARLDDDGCLTETSSYSVKPSPESRLGLTFEYERFVGSGRHTGSSLASRELEDAWPSDATELDLDDERYGDEGFLATGAAEGYSRVDVWIRDRNVLVRVSYRIDQPFPAATERARDAADEMLEELNDYLTS